MDDYIIVSFPLTNKHFICKTIDGNHTIWVNDVPIKGSVISICDTYEEAQETINLLK